MDGVTPAEPTADVPASPMGRFEIPLAALASAIAFSTLLFVPLLGALGVPLAGVPLVRLTHRRGVVAGLIGCGLTAALVFGVAWAAAGPSDALAAAFVAAGVTLLPTASVGFLRAAADPSRCYLGLCVAGAAFIGAAFAAAAGGPGPGVGAQVAAGFDRLITAAVESYARSGADAEMLARMRAVMETTREFVRQYLWGVLGALWVLAAAISFYGGARAARPVPTAEAARYETLRLPAAAAGLFVASGAAFGVLSGVGRRVAGNLLLPLLTLFFVAGLSIICHFFRRWFRVRLLRAGLYALAAYFPVNVGVALLGLFDWYVDFRRRGEGVRQS